MAIYLAIVYEQVMKNWQVPFLWYILYIYSYFQYCFYEKILILSEQTYPVELVILKYLLYKSAEYMWL